LPRKRKNLKAEVGDITSTGVEGNMKIMKANNILKRNRVIIQGAEVEDVEGEGDMIEDGGREEDNHGGTEGIEMREVISIMILIILNTRIGNMAILSNMVKSNKILKIDHIEEDLSIINNIAKEIKRKLSKFLYRKNL
jgi:hypothetical protein